MTDHRGLIGKLLKLAETEPSGEDGWRRIGRASDPDPLAAVLREIDETQLPRQLSFRNDRGQMLHMEAGNRRLRRVEALSWADPSSIEGLPKENVSQPSDAEIDAIGTVFRTFQPGDQKVWVRSEGLPAAGEASQSGLTATALARALSIDLDERSDEFLHAAFEEFVRAQAPLSEAWLRFENGEIRQQSQPQPDTEWRDCWIAADRTDLQNGSHLIQNAPCLLILGSGVEGEPHHLMATNGDTSVVLRVGAADVAQLAQIWRDLGL